MENLISNAPKMIDHLDDESKIHFSMLRNYLDSLEIPFVVNPKLVRGLDYYNQTVFEWISNDLGSQGTICGGGRYDKLLSTLGGKDLPATGFGFGDMVIMELLAEKNLIPELVSDIDDIVIPLNSDLRNAAVMVAASLRNSGRTVDLVLEDKKMKWAFKHAERIGAARLVLLAPDEWSRKMVKIKDLDTGEESEISLNDI
jgi:histidyl-tRNA synthetase